MKCPKCQSEMEEGVVADRGHYDAAEYPEWGTKIEQKLIRPMSKVINKKYVSTYRCKKCGFLESYAL